MDALGNPLMQRARTLGHRFFHRFGMCVFATSSLCRSISYWNPRICDAPKSLRDASNSSHSHLCYCHYIPLLSRPRYILLVSTALSSSLLVSDP